MVNSFSAVISDPVKANIAGLKSTLMIILYKHFLESKMSQKDYAKVLGIHQSQVSNLVNSRLHFFTVDKLLELVGKAGYSIDSSINQSPKRPASFSITKR